MARLVVLNTVATVAKMHRRWGAWGLVQNLTFVDGNATGETSEGGGGGAILVQGGRLKVVNSRPAVVASAVE